MSTMRAIDTSRASEDALAWAALVCEHYAHELATPHPRMANDRETAPAALHGVSALAIRVNRADVLVHRGVEVLVGAESPAMVDDLHDLDRLRPEGLSALWDSPDFGQLYRFGLIEAPELTVGYDTAIADAANAIRREALAQAEEEILVSSNAADEFCVRALTPGWAVLQALGQFAEAGRLVANGVLSDDALVNEFRWAAATITTAMSAFPEDCALVFAQLGTPRRGGEPGPIRTWPLLVADMANTFLSMAWEREVLLHHALLQGGGVRDHRAALTTLAHLANTLPQGLTPPHNGGHSDPDSRTL